MRWLGLLCSFFLLFACGRSPSVPSPGLTTSGPRIVVLSPAVAVILRDLGAGGLVVGRHNYGMVFKDRPACGQQGAIDYEQLLAVSPTDVLIEWGSGALPDRLLELADRNAWQVRRFELLTLDDIERATDELQRLYAPDRPGEPLSRTLQEAFRPVEGVERVGRVLVLGAVSPPTVLGPGSFHAQVLDRLGARSAVPEGGPWMELGLEDVLRLAPDAVVLVMPREGGTGIGATGETAIEQLGVLGRLDIPAVRRGRVAVLDGELYHTPSTAMADFARDLATVLREWAGVE